jgi:hypothetical protein
MPLRLTIRVWEAGLSRAAEAARFGLEVLDQRRSAAPGFESHRPPVHPGYAGNGAPPAADAPWDGYDRMTAADICDRLSAASPTEAAAVELYEATHKGRRTVLDAAERALRP